MLPRLRLLRAAASCLALRASPKNSRRLKERGRPAHRSCFDVGGSPTHLEFFALSRLSPLARAAALALALLASPALLVNHASAGTTWDGDASASTGNWQSAGNWEGVLPTFDATTDLLFRNFSSNNRTTSCLQAATTVRSLTFDGTNDANTTLNLSGAINSTSNSRTLTFSSNSGNATLTVEAGSTGDKLFTRPGNATANIALSSSLDVVHNGSGTLTFGNLTIVTGTGGINKSGTGTLILAGNNTYTGNTTISAGTLQLANVNALQNTTLDTGT
ncbi:MAG: autotransporter-associated beta strand repeat-containing protein, partial [Spartobacteria bacterium]